MKPTILSFLTPRPFVLFELMADGTLVQLDPGATFTIDGKRLLHVMVQCELEQGILKQFSAIVSTPADPTTTICVVSPSNHREPKAFEVKLGPDGDPLDHTDPAALRKHLPLLMGDCQTFEALIFELRQRFRIGKPIEVLAHAA